VQKESVKGNAKVHGPKRLYSSGRKVKNRLRLIAEKRRTYWDGQRGRDQRSQSWSSEFRGRGVRGKRETTNAFQSKKKMEVMAIMGPKTGTWNAVLNNTEAGATCLFGGEVKKSRFRYNRCPRGRKKGQEGRSAKTKGKFNNAGLKSEINSRKRKSSGTIPSLCESRRKAG